ncbi:HEAT repeat domain-containing protein [Oculatella sp. FACHB-28]|uniref:HEAT repeat domain-containing protein n=1 Tax=Oculatella sp. FACHB-28 TaxID=2692845 RepID=UPI001685D9D5|nr:HEAT repeat domain-containing protein [Oculatella sp. FACHB-28]MBD2060262.1 HEAT repeat domain-containing protein [Oculatella sp. FACHB-28]
MEPVSVMIGAWLGEWATLKVSETVLTGVSSKLHSSDLDKALKAATKAAQEQHRQLFFRCEPDFIPKFLEQFFKGSGLQELQKPLNNQGAPQVDFLVAAFREAAQEDPKMQKVDQLLVEPWLKVFVETYFSKTDTFLRFQIAKEDYFKQLVNRFDDVKFGGIAVEGQETDKSEKLVQIFVMPDVQEEKQASSLDRFDMEIEQFKSRQDALLWEQRRRSQLESSGQKFSAQLLLSQSKAQKQVLLGAPGSGKTTLMSYFAVKLALKRPQDLGLSVDTDWLPILIRIRDLERHPDLSPLQFIQQFATVNLSVKSLPPGFFEYWLEDGRALILLDGLDEVADPAKRSEVVLRLECFLGQYAQNRAIITSRPAGYRRDFFRTDEFPHFELLPFDDSKIEEFTRRWYGSRIADHAEADRRKESLSKALTEQPRIKRLAQNPLLLTIIALIHRYQARLPKERHRLYDKAVETLLTTWDAGREITTHSVLRYLTLDDLRRLMERLAYWIHNHPEGSTGEQEGGTLIDRHELMTQLSQFIREQKKIEPHEAKAEAKRFLDHIRDRTGLLNEQGQDCYAFVHKTFQEYLTAQEIRDRQEEGLEVVLEHFREHLHDAHWREALLLLIAQQRRTNPTKVIQTILQQPTPYENWLHRNLLFAGSCLAEDIEVVDELALDVLQRLVELEVSQSALVTSKIRQRVFRIVCSLNETRYEIQALQLLKAKDQQLEKIRLQEYQAALGEEEESLLLLLGLLQDLKSDVRSSAATALGKLGKDSEPVVQGLLGLLQDPESDVRSSAAAALVKLGKNSKPVVQELLGSLQDPAFIVHSSAADALVKLGKDSEPVVQGLLGLLQDPAFMVRYSAAAVLGKLGKDSEPVVQGLLGLLQDPAFIVRSSAAEALSKLGKDSEAVVQRLLSLLQAPAFIVRYSAAEALGKLGKDSEAVVQGLLGLLQDPESIVRSSAAEALGKLGKDSEPAVHGLLGLLQDPESIVRSSAAEALIKLGKDSEPAVALLLGLLQDPNFIVRYRAAEALVKLSKDSEPVVQGLLSLLQAPDFMVRSSAAEALGKLGKDSEAVVQGLLGLLQDPDFMVRYRAASALGELGKKTAVGVPAEHIVFAVAEWIEQHQDSEYVGDGVDALWGLVVRE